MLIWTSKAVLISWVNWADCEAKTMVLIVIIFSHWNQIIVKTEKLKIFEHPLKRKRKMIAASLMENYEWENEDEEKSVKFMVIMLGWNCAIVLVHLLRQLAASKK